MKKLLAIILTGLLLIPCATAFAADRTVTIPVYATCSGGIAGEYFDGVDDGTAEITTEDGTIVRAEEIDENARYLIVVPIPRSENAAWRWLTDCVEDRITPAHAFFIYFSDLHGNRFAADGAVVTIKASCTAKTRVCSLTTAGTEKRLASTLHSDAIRFTTDGAPYYILGAGVEHPITIDKTPGGDVTVRDDAPIAGDTVTIVTKPDDGKSVESVTVTDSDGNAVAVTDNGDGTYSFTQPDSDVTVSVVFKDNAHKPPKMGDPAATELWVLCMIAALGVLCAICFHKKRE